MTERRVLPNRTNRGKRYIFAEEQKQINQPLDSNLSEKTQDSCSTSNAPRSKKVSKTSEKELERKQLLYVNRLKYPFTRAYHYFTNLDSFPRSESSPSYALDSNNYFKSVYPNESKKITEEITVGSVLNRVYIGLPKIEGNLAPPPSKNPAYFYLCQNEDKKYQIDRQILQLKTIITNLPSLLSTEKIYTFSILNKDQHALHLITNKDETMENKIEVLKEKIEALQRKKENLLQEFLSEDERFFKHSLNQILHRKIENLNKSLKYESIFKWIENVENWKQKIKQGGQEKGQGEEKQGQEREGQGDEGKEGEEGKEEKEGEKGEEKGEEETKERTGKVFRYGGWAGQGSEEGMCLSEGKIQNVIGWVWENENFDDVPFAFFSFGNKDLMKMSENILALRLANLNEASFFVCKVFWKKVFGRELKLNKEIRILSRQEFDKSMTTTIKNLAKWKKRQEKHPQNPTLSFPLLDSLITLENPPKTLFPRESEVSITPREFFCLILFHSLYKSVSEIFTFVQNNESMITLISSEFYSKAHNFVVQIMGSPSVGIMDDTLKKISEAIVRPDFESEWEMKWVHREQEGVSYVFKEEKGKREEEEINKRKK